MQASISRSFAAGRHIAATAAASGAMPRQRGSKTILAHLPADTTYDLIGPPDPLTNLRPIYYTPRFVEPATHGPNGTVARNRKVHPYSLDEFSTSTMANASASIEELSVDQSSKRRIKATQKRHAKLMQLEQLRARFEAEDLEWRLRKRRLQRISHEHWSRSNYAFHREKEEAVARAQAEVSCEFEALERFHHEWVNAGHGRAFEKYQSEWLSGLFGQLVPDVKAIYRDYRWKLEMWRCGLLHKQIG